MLWRVRPVTMLSGSSLRAGVIASLFPKVQKPLCQCPARRGELKYTSRVCPPRSGERPRALCLRCLTMKAGGFRGCSGGAILPRVGHAGLRPGLWFKPGAKQTRPLLALLWTLLALAYVAWENMKTHSPALTRNPENCLRPLEVNKRFKKISLREVSWKVPQFWSGEVWIP